MKSTRNPWPWAIGIFIGCFAIAMASFVVWSLRHRQDLVMQDYYEQDLNYQAQMEQIARATAQDGHTFAYDASARAFNIALPDAASNAVVKLYRPSRAALDKDLPVITGEENAIRLPANDLAPGLWRAHLQWDQAGAIYRANLAFVVE
ncbi:MAG TPA: FixH family protein [Kiritimatiellia bacterium]|nr:FixH family protein [Kiritimatiellia bacterium]